MSAELPRPGVEVIQEFQAQSPTVLLPTLVPFVTGPAKEIVEVTDADGLVNEDALQGSYEQLPLFISQTAFPSPRGNISEVNVEEGSIQAFLEFGGSLSQLDRDPGSTFLAAHNNARRAAIRSAEIGGGGLAIQGQTIVLAIDVRARLNVSEDVTVTFAGAGNLSAQDVADQINAAVGDTVATLIPDGPVNRVQVASSIYGAGSSVTLRAGASGNVTFGAVSDAVEYRVEGAGFYAQDQADNTTQSPYVVWSQGQYLEDGVAATFPAAPAANEIEYGQIGKDLDGVETFEISLAPSISFTGAGSIDLKVGDYFYADGVRPNGAEVSRVEENRFKLGTVNVQLSTFDDDGNVLTAVYDNADVQTLFGSVAFAPEWAWFRARNIVQTDGVATQAELLGSIQGNPAEVGSVSSSGATGPFLLTGLSLVTKVVLDGVEQDEHTFIFGGGTFNVIGDVTAAIGTSIPNVVVSDNGSEITFSTTKTGKDQSVQILASSTVLAGAVNLGLSAGTGVGKDVEFVDVPAVLISGDHTFPFSLGVASETLAIEVSTDGGLTFPTTYTHTFASQGPYADANALATALNVPGDWDTDPSSVFVVDDVNGTDKISITAVTPGSAIVLRVQGGTALGVAPASDLQFTAGQSDQGEENLAGTLFKFRLNDRPQTYTVALTSDSLDDAVDEINDVVGYPVAYIGGGLEDQLLLRSPLEGAASKVTIVDDGVNNLAASAFGMTGGNSEDVGSGRPDWPDFYVDIDGEAVIGPEVLRDQVTGQPFGPGVAQLYIQYTALRLDLSPQAANPALISVSDVDTLQTLLNPITSANPLGLAMFFQIINAPGLVCKGMSISEATAAAPEGTAVAYTEVANFLESEEVYAIAPLTRDRTVFDILRTHVDFMSGAAQKGERILFQSPPVPDRAVDDVIASGLSANTTATQNELVLDVNPTAALVAAGINPAGTIPVDSDLYVQVTVATGSGQEVRYYSVQTVSNTLVVFRTTFGAGENVDAFFSTTPLTETLVNVDWSMKVRGEPLYLPGSTLLDKDRVAETVAAQNSGIGNRRVYSLFPDTVRASLSGTEEALPSYYAAAAITGMVAGQTPQQGFTNLPMTGFTGVVGSSDKYSRRQLDVMAGGGTYILIQDVAGGAVTSRHQLSTDLTSIETRELSITKVVDYVAKFMRTGLRNFIGTFNITQPFLDTLSTVVTGMLSFLTENGVILGGDLNNLVQDTDQPDTVLVDITLDIPYPCNYIRLTLVI